MVWFLARRNLRRSISRTVLLVAGVTMSGALLFDMSMLGGGLEQSFGAVLGRLGYEIRVVLRGTLPLSTESLMPDAAQTARRIEGHTGVAVARPVLGTNLYVAGPGGRAAAVALGLTPEVAGIVKVIETGGITRATSGVILNRELAQQLRVGPGDTVRLATRIDPQTGRPTATDTVPVVGIGEFVFDLKAQRTLALPLNRLQVLMGISDEQASFVVVKVRPGTDPETVVRWIEDSFPTLDAFSIQGLLGQVRAQLTYFNHFAAILTGVSLLVSLLLIGAVLTLAVGERLGELAALRAVGLSQPRLVLLVLLEGAVLALASTPLALLLGAAASRPLDAILRVTPGIPQDLHFFVFTPGAVLRTVALLLTVGTLGAGYPAWVCGRLNIAATLHREVQ